MRGKLGGDCQDESRANRDPAHYCSAHRVGLLQLVERQPDGSLRAGWRHPGVHVLDWRNALGQSGTYEVRDMCDLVHLGIAEQLAAYERDFNAYAFRVLRRPAGG
jgi:hypothetical protein